MELVKDINPHIFRGYDIRGVYPHDLNLNVAYTIGKSFGSKLRSMGKNICIVGHDNRYSSEELHEGLTSGLRDSGVNVITLGLVTTPMYYYALIKYNVPSGIMITASHNPKDDNGFKMAYNEDGNIYGDTIKELQTFTKALNFTNGYGYLEHRNIEADYKQLLKDSLSFGNRKVKVVIDCGNGTTSLFAKEIYESFNLDLIPLYAESDPSFPNHHPDPTVEENLAVLKQTVLENNADVGLAFDGDGDRIGVVTNEGKYIPADIYMIIMLRDIFKKSTNKKVLYDVKCSKALKDEIEKLGGEGISYRVGNSYTKWATKKYDCIMGGEYSGHIYFRDKFLGFDSALYAGLRLVEILSHTDQNISDLLTGINKYYATPEIIIPSKDETKFQIVEQMKDYCLQMNYPVNDIDGVRVDFPDGWALIRASNTGPNITARFEGITEEKKNALQAEFITKLNEFNQ